MTIEKYGLIVCETGSYAIMRPKRVQESPLDAFRMKEFRAFLKKRNRPAREQGRNPRALPTIGLQSIPQRMNKGSRPKK